MNHLRRNELYRDFVRTRQHWFNGTEPGIYCEEDSAFLDFLERERKAGRVKAWGQVLSWEEYLKKVYRDTRNSPGWQDIFEAHDEEDRGIFIALELDKPD